MDEWSGSPLHLSNVPHLLPDVAPKWCSDNLLHASYEIVGSLVHALTIALDTSEVELWLAVKHLLLWHDPDVNVLVDYWLQIQNTPLMRYLSVCSNVGSPVDGLFLWLASYAFSMHVNIIHGIDGIWTTCHTAIPDFQNLAIVFVLGYYMAAPACQLTGSPKKKSTQSSRG